SAVGRYGEGGGEGSSRLQHVRLWLLQEQVRRCPATTSALAQELSGERETRAPCVRAVLREADPAPRLVAARQPRRPSEQPRSAGVTMRLLFLALSFPLPANNGHKIRTWALLRALAAEGHEVSLLAFAREDETMEGQSSLGAVCRDVDIVEHVLLRRNLRREPNPVRRAYASLEAFKMERWERRAWARAAVAMACSDVDRRTINRLCPECSTVIVPNVVDAETYTPNGAGQAGRVLFQGGMDWFPNQDAAAYFISEILPTVRSLVPHVRFVVAGRNPSPTLLRRFARITDVEFTGTVPEMRDELAKAAVCAVPLRIGSGTRLKILEAAAMARAVVSTRIGMEGLGFTDGWDILVADGPHAFAHALVRVRRRTELGGAIG